MQDGKSSKKSRGGQGDRDDHHIPMIPEASQIVKVKIYILTAIKIIERPNFI